MNAGGGSGGASASHFRKNCYVHPVGFEAADSGWPRVLRRFAAEAWRRAESGEFTDEELYPADAQWSGIYDRMHTRKPDEVERRQALAADYGEGFAR